MNIEQTANLDTSRTAPQAAHAQDSLQSAAEEGKNWQRAFLIAACVMGLMLVLVPLMWNLRLRNDHYVYLAHNFVQGSLAVDDLPRVYPDVVIVGGHRYLPLGPLPAVLLIPFLPLLEIGMRLAFVSHLFTLLNIWLFYGVLGRAGVTGERRRWMLLLFFGGTVYFSMALVDASYFFAHIVTVTFLLLAIRETLGQRRPWLIGLALGLAGATRLTALFSLPFFLWMLWRTRTGYEKASERDAPQTPASLPTLVRNYGLVALGLAGPLALLGLYNYARFGSPLESGYGLAALGAETLIEARSYGMFSLAHVPKNLFMMLLQGPEPFQSADDAVLQFPYVWPSPWGMGIFYTSPALLYAFRHFRERLKLPPVQASWLGILFVMLPVLTYYGVGWIQFGYRYALDFMPFLLLLAATALPNPLPRLAKGLVLVSVAVTLWGSIWLTAWI